MVAGSPGSNSLACALAIALVAAAAPVRAQTGDSVAQAEGLFREGRDAMRGHRFAEACDKFRESDALDPSPGTRLNWALCDEQVGHLVQALEHARRALDRVSADDVRRPIAVQLAAKLEKRVARLTVRLASPPALDARVYLDGEALPMQGSEQTRAVDPGSHVIVVDEPAHETAHLVVSVGEGANTVSSVSAGPALRDDGARSRAAVPSRTPGLARPVGYVFGISALASLGAAAILGGLALGERGIVERDCPAKQCDPEGFDAGQRARTFANASALAFTFGVACGTGATILLRTHKPTATASLVPLLGGAAFSLRAGF